MKFSARLRIGILTFLIILLLPVVLLKVHAQSSYLDPQTEVNVPKNMGTFTQGLFINIEDAILCQLAGVSMHGPNHQCLSVNQSTGLLGYAPSTHSFAAGGAIGTTTNLISDTYSLPIHSTDYFAYLGEHFGLTPKAYAQGVGFQGLSPLIPVWTTFRNLVYLVYVIVFIVIGGAIMLRLKIDPRTVMTIENSLPKIIVSLILVTFSFAIAGLLIDLMWVAVFVVINLLVSIDPYNATTGLGIFGDSATNNLFTNPFGYVNSILVGSHHIGGLVEIPATGGRALQEVISNVFSLQGSSRLGIFPPNQSTDPNCNQFIIGFFKCVIPNTVGGVVTNVIGFIISWILGALATIVIFIAILVSLLRVWLQLIQAYFLIILDVVTAPFWILIGAFPGGKNGFELWLRDMLGWLIAFPIVIALFLFGKVLIDIFSTTAINTLFVPPLISNPNGGVPGSGFGQVANPIGAILGIAMILLAPQAVKISRDTFKSPNIPYIAGIFQSVGIGVKAVTGVVKTVVGAATQQEIEYNEQGQIKPINNPIAKLRKRLFKGFSG